MIGHMSYSRIGSQFEDLGPDPRPYDSACLCGEEW